jgi:hypothetical protein
MDFQRVNGKDRAGLKFEGGSGDSQEDAIVIKNADNHLAGVEAEYLYLQKRFGERDLHWRLIRQTFRKGKNLIDQLTIELKDGNIKNIYFDISDFYGKG